MDKKYANREEIFERNPFLAKNWFTRFFAGSIIMGARLDAKDGRSARLFLFAAPVLIFIFSIDFFIGTQMSTGRRVLGLALIIFFSLGYPLIIAINYGYRYRDKIDATGAFKGDFKQVWRYAIIGAGIGAALTAYLAGKI